MNLESFTLEQKIGQLFLVGHADVNVSGDLINLITKYHVGGITYTGHQRQNPKKVAQFSNTIQKYSDQRTPLFISISEDSTQSIEGMINLPNKLALGALDNRLYSKKVAEIVGEQLNNLGINMIFSPNLNLTKSEANNQYTLFPFGENVKKVKKHATDMIQGFRKGKVIPNLNYFPTIEDNGQIHPISEHSLLPFMYAIQQGIDILMISHAEEASISPQIIKEGLREKIGYEGIIMTDSLEKLTQKNQYELHEAAILALKAGADMIYLNESLEKQYATMDAVIKAVKTGELKEENIDESIRRILRVKNKYHLSELPTFNHDLVSKTQHIEFAKKLNEQAITIVKNEVDTLPLNKSKDTIVLIPATNKTSSKQHELSSEHLLLFNNFLYDYLEHFTSFPLTNDENLLQACEKAEQIIIPVTDLSNDKSSLLVIKQILQQYNDKIVICAFGNPFGLLEVNEAATLMLTYDTSLMSMQAMAKVLFHNRRTRAKLPLTLSEQWQIGHQAK